MPLRQALSGYLRRRRGIEIGADQLLIVTGIQQGIDLAARVLLNPGQRALIEEPCYPGLRSALRAHGAEVCGVAVDRHGLRTHGLASTTARLLAVTPSHQFPTGAALPLSRRLEILQWATQCGAFVLEDDYDGEYRHGGAPLPAMKSLDAAGRVIYLGSLSRVLFPAARLGYLVLPPALRDAFIAAKSLADRGSPAIEQRALADLIATGRFERLLLANARRLNPRRMALLAAIEAHLPEGIEVIGADAGMHLSVRFPGLPASLEPSVVSAAALSGVSLEGIGRYCEQPAQCLQLLLGYAQLGPEDLMEALRRLASVLPRVADQAAISLP
jgi:GntR family transcriptional regulator/MocR family aminotransferase